MPESQQPSTAPVPTDLQRDFDALERAGFALADRCRKQVTKRSEQAPEPRHAREPSPEAGLSADRRSVGLWVPTRRARV